MIIQKDTINKEKEFKIGSDFELHILKKRNESEKKREVITSNDFSGLRYMNLGFFIITPILLGVILGFYIDNRLHTRPIATISLLLSGVVASFYNLFRMFKAP